MSIWPIDYPLPRPPRFFFSGTRPGAGQSPAAQPAPRSPAAQSPPAPAQPRQPAAPEAESGWTTSEFWATQITAGVAVITACGADFGLFTLTPAQKTDVTMAALFVAGLLQVSYALARSWRKRGTAA